MPRVLSVLLVEDSSADGRLLLEAIRPATTAGEVVVQTVKRLALAIEALKTYDFNCVLLDLGLPDGQGVGNVRALREVDRKTAIIVLTGLDDEKTAGEALSLGAQDYLVKGECDGEQLIKQLRRAVQRNRQMFVAEQRRDQAFYETSHDALTQLPNAALFAERARQQLVAARLGGQSFSVACLQLQGLAGLRDRHGSMLADDLLRTLARRCSDALGPGDTLARLGDGEFGLLRQAGPGSADWPTVLDDLRRQFDSVQTLLPEDATLAWGAATAEAVDDSISIDNLLSNARAALSASLVIDTTPDQPAKAAAPSEALLNARWQPWLDITTRRCVGVQLIGEPRSGPDDAGAAAEQALASSALVAEQLRHWRARDMEPQTIAFGLRVAALEAPGFLDAFCSSLQHCELPARQVQLHIGERAFRQLDRYAPALGRLRSQGFGLVMEGDGSKDITLHDFAAFPVDGYKLSAELVQALSDQTLHGAPRRLVSAMLGAAQQLGAVVIAGGVDTEAAVTALRLIGLRLMQGSALLPPLAAATVAMAWTQPLPVGSPG